MAVKEREIAPPDRAAWDRPANGTPPDSRRGTPVIEIEGLTKRYGTHYAVKDLHLTLYEGEIFGLLGPNGAGKTTTILMLMGLTEPTAGKVRVLGLDPSRDPIGVKSQVGYLPENIGFYDELTGYENLQYTARLNGLPREVADARIRSLLKAVGLEEAGDRPVRVYSRGMRQRLGLADVLVKQPRIAILDEPTLGIDPAGTREILELIARLAQEQRVTVLISSHLLHQIQQICHRAGIFVGGRLIAVGAVEELSRQLTGSAPITIRVEVGADAPQPVEELLQQLPEVLRVERRGQEWLVHCRQDVREAIARQLVAHQVPLIGLGVHTYALDDVYQTYFEGMKSHGQ